MSLREILTVIGGLGGLVALTKYIVDLIVNRRQRSATVELTELDADDKRVQMADSIIAHLQVQLTSQQSEIEMLRKRLDNRVKVESALRRRVYRLERICLTNGLELPEEENVEGA